MAGCDCEEWKDEWALSGIDPTLKYEDGVWQELTRKGWKIITRCPWCKTKPTEGAGDVQAR